MAVETAFVFLFISAILVAMVAIIHYSKNWIVPAFAFIALMGAFTGLLINNIEGYEWVTDFVYEKLADFILYLFIPILIFSAGYNLKMKDLKNEALPIGFFATIGVILTIVLIGVPISIAFQIPVQHALLFGAILAATDPVVVEAIFKQFPIPHRLHVQIEGESLFNDATGVVSVNMLTAVVITGVSLTVAGALGWLAWAVCAGVALGSAIGWLTARLVKTWGGLPYIEVTLTIAAAIGGFALAEGILAASGVITVLFTALIYRRSFRKIGMERNEFSQHIWIYLDLMINAMLFFFIGLSLFLVAIPGSTLVFFLVPFGLLLASRFIVIYAGWGVLGFITKGVPTSWKNVLSFGGVRGGIAVALVLSLPVDYEYKVLFVSLVGWAILINLFVNPVFLGTYIRGEKLDEESLPEPSE